MEKSALAKAIKDNKEKPYEPTIEEVLYWRDVMNNEVFFGRVPCFNGVTLRKRRGVWGECLGDYWDSGKTYIEMRLNRNYHSLSHFLNVLAHEIIHAIQYAESGEMEHDDFFWKWELPLKSHGIVLKGEY